MTSTHRCWLSLLSLLWGCGAVESKLSRLPPSLEARAGAEAPPWTRGTACGDEPSARLACKDHDAQLTRDPSYCVEGGSELCYRELYGDLDSCGKLYEPFRTNCL